jgi:hypothetical protein
MSLFTFPVGPDPIQQAFDRGLEAGGDLYEELSALGDYPVTTEGEARSLARGVHRLGYQLGDRANDPILHLIAGLFQAVESAEAFDVLRVEGLPRLLEAYDARVARLAEHGAETLLFVLKVAALYRVEAAVERISAAARTPVEPESLMWSVLFNVFDETHPYRAAVLSRLRSPLPEGFIGVAYLDLANTMARGGYLGNHPFDTPEGIDRLRAWLTDAGETSFARSAAASLPFLSGHGRDDLLALAMDHPSLTVQMEGAWASARLGSESALKFLARTCLDPGHSATAVAHLARLGRDDLVPAQARAPDFQAVAELAAWLGDPAEHGRPPDAIEVVDTRTIHWPPTEDRRQLWLVRFRYDPKPPDDPGESGVGLVGSITFSLSGQTSADMPPDDVYALHCCWELEVNNDPRTPTSISVAAGRRLLGEGLRLDR